MDGARSGSDRDRDQSEPVPRAEGPCLLLREASPGVEGMLPTPRLCFVLARPHRCRGGPGPAF